MQAQFLRNALARVPGGSAEMVAAAIRTIFAQPTAAEVTDQLDKVAAMLARNVPSCGHADRCPRGPDRFCSLPAIALDQAVEHQPAGTAQQEVQRPTNVVGIFPNDAAVLRLAGAVLLEVHDQWQVAERR